jgi:hypothetical protein
LLPSGPRASVASTCSSSSYSSFYCSASHSRGLAPPVAFDDTREGFIYSQCIASLIETRTPTANKSPTASNRKTSFSIICPTV